MIDMYDPVLCQQYNLNCSSLNASQYDIEVTSLPASPPGPEVNGIAKTAIVAIKGNQIDPGKGNTQ